MNLIHIPTESLSPCSIKVPAALTHMLPDFSHRYMLGVRFIIFFAIRYFIFKSIYIFPNVQKNNEIWDKITDYFISLKVMPFSRIYFVTNALNLSIASTSSVEHSRSKPKAKE
jgi:hypothetical protein